MEDLTYSNISTSLLSLFPELRELYQEELEIWKESTPGPYVVFGATIMPYLKKELDARRNGLFVERAMEFFEEMARSEDIQVVNLLQVEILEYLVGNPEALQVAWQHMGEKTRSLTVETAKIWHREQNLPQQKDRA